MADEEPYEVGFGKPPRHSQFKPGQSGNPRGRPRKGQSVLDLIERELDGRIVVTDKGKKKQILKREAMAKTFVHNLIKGGAVGNYRTYFELTERRRAAAEYREMLREEAAAQLEDDDQPVIVTMDLGDPETQFRVAQAALERSSRDQRKEPSGSDRE